MLHPLMELVHGLRQLVVVVVVVVQLVVVLVVVVVEVLVRGEQSAQCAGVGEVAVHPQKEGRQAEGSACA